MLLYKVTKYSTWESYRPPQEVLSGILASEVPIMAVAQNDTEYLVNRLKDLGFSYEAIGNQIGVHWRTVYRWGRGENHPWSPRAVNQLLASMLRINRG